MNWICLLQPFYFIILQQLVNTQISGPPTPEATLPFWLLNADYQNYRSSELLPQEANVVIIGAGISGVSTAYHLATEYQQDDIVLLDARGVCGGASGRNGGVFQTLSPGSFTYITNTYTSNNA
eukprot:398982_1